MYKLANLSFVLQANKRRFVSTSVSLCLRSGLETLRVQGSNSSNSRPPEGVARKSGIPTHTRQLGVTLVGVGVGTQQLLMASLWRWPSRLPGAPGGVWVQQTMDRPEPDGETETGITKPGSRPPRTSPGTKDKDGKLVTTLKRNVLPPTPHAPFQTIASLKHGQN